MIHVEDVMSTVGGYNLLLFEYLHGTEHPHITHDILHSTKHTFCGVKVMIF